MMRETLITIANHPKNFPIRQIIFLIP